jgi:hypothetical protein
MVRGGHVGTEGWTDIVMSEKTDDWVKAFMANPDPYGAEVIGGAILVMAQLAVGKDPAAAAQDVFDDLSVFQMCLVAEMVSALSPRGEEFRRWWNFHVPKTAVEESRLLRDTYVKALVLALVISMIAGLYVLMCGYAGGP